MRPIEALIEAAVRAPSGDNTQPLFYTVSRSGDLVTVHVDEQRDSSPMNAGQRMARIALGAAVENMACTARWNGWSVTLKCDDRQNRASLRLVAAATDRAEIPPHVLSRMTNRRFYNRQELTGVQRDRLLQLSSGVDGASIHWVTEPKRIRAVGELIGEADQQMFGISCMRSAFLRSVRFEEPPNATVEEGLSIGALELSRPAAVALRMFARLPDGILRLVGGTRQFKVHARRLVESASGLCVAVSDGSGRCSDIESGRMMQRIWLELTELGFSVQPMMSLPVLQNVLDNGSDELRDSLDARGTRSRRLLAALLAELRAAVSSRAVFLLRFGFSEPPTARVGRLRPKVAQVPDAETQTPGSH